MLLQPVNGRSKAALLEACKMWAAPARMRGSEAEMYLSKRGISAEMGNRYGLGFTGDNPHGEYSRFRNMISIPNINRNMQPVGVKFRRLSDDGGPKYDQPAGQVQRLFNLRSLNHAGNVIHIAEGELDAISLSLAGAPAVGVPGASAWKQYHHLLFEQYQMVVVWFDDDEAGRGLLKTIKATGLPVVGARVPDCKDPNDFLACYGLDALTTVIREYDIGNK